MATYTIKTSADQERGLAGVTNAANDQIAAGNKALDKADQRTLMTPADYLTARVADLLDSFAGQYPELPPVEEMKAALDDASDGQKARIAAILAEGAEPAEGAVS